MNNLMKNYCYIKTYGCSANQNNSEIIAGLLRQSGYQLTNNIDIAEIYIINTCIVKKSTISKIKRYLQDISEKYPKKIKIITGCMTETDLEELKKINKDFLFLGLFNIKKILVLLKDLDENKLSEKRQEDYILKNNEEKILLPKISTNKLISITQISEGCLGNCSYCKTKLAKGKLFSYPEDKIIKSIENDLKQGAKEIWLTSQDSASYGMDMDDKKPRLPGLLNKILSLKHNFKLRLGMMNPNHVYPILDELIRVYENKKMYKFLHIPIQSASNVILRHMNRDYNVEKVEEIIKRFKENFPDITISTDIITCYPIETIKDHKKNLEFIEKYKPDVFNLSKFSSHKNTIAGNLQVLKKETVSKRSSELMDLHRKTAKANKQKYLGKILNVFVDKKTKINNVYEARDMNYNIVLIGSKDKSILGKNINVKIKGIGVHHMIGEIVY
jgi:threonylcarbamoyladenosine tRNA methylthiotransferase CDKAL1